MAFTIRTLLGSELIKGIRIEAGLNYSDPVIDWVNVMEILDSPHTVESGELLVTTGFGLEQQNRHKDLIETLQARGVCGLVIQPGYYIEEIPDYIIDAANRMDFPVLSIPKDISFSEILHTLMEALNQHSEYRAGRSRELKLLFRQIPAGFDIRGKQLYLIAPAESASGLLDLDTGISRIHSFLSSTMKECLFLSNGKGSALFICENKESFHVFKAIAHDLNMKLREVYEEFGCNLYVGAEEHTEEMTTEIMFEHALSGMRLLERIEAKRGACTYDNIVFVESFGRLYKNRGTALEDNNILQMMMNYDRQHRTEYVNTIQVYLASSCNTVRTAERLYIHRHTLINRIKTIKDLFGLDFTDHYARVYMSIDLLLRDYYSE